MDGIASRRLAHPHASREGQLHQGQLPLRSHRPTYLTGRPLDFCLLALCSCLLSVMCHQTGSVASQSPTASTTTPPQIDFVVKAGLATAPRLDIERAEDEEAQG
ncbi:MAG: hypothetical protein ACFB4J_04505 [Elainellaceae cyanobacterium]